MVVSVMLAWFVAAGDEETARRQGYLEQLRRTLPASQSWEAWLEATHELPPDFQVMPSCAALPDPLLRYQDGQSIRVASASEWEAHRQTLRNEFHQWILGAVPPPPDNLRASVITSEEREGAVFREVELTFGPAPGARLRLELLIPKGEGPFPVFMTQHNHRAWALIALRRGYLCCVYAGCDSDDDTDSFIDVYPDYDWSRLTRRAWAASRCIDYLTLLPESALDRIAITGHSRNGKQSLIAAAMDDRISLVISSSSGQGGSLTTRYYSEQHFGEGIENITRVFPDWFHPRLRFFVGREHKLPVDFHELVALVAPRPCLLSSACNDGCASTWAEQQTYAAVQPVYALYGAEDNLRILWRPGNHETWTTTIEQYLDWCDAHFGRGMHAIPERFVYPVDSRSHKRLLNKTLEHPNWPERVFDDVLTAKDGTAVSSAETWASRRTEILDIVRFMMGEAPPVGPTAVGIYGEEPDHIEIMLRRDEPGNGVEKEDCVFGEYINADIYMPKGTEKEDLNIPIIIWLHPFSFPYGYTAAYGRGQQIYRTFARNGFAVFCFDQIGCGRRVEEIEGFYRRHPQWSLLGKMVRDTQAAIDAASQLPYVDKDQIWLVGFGLGSFVGLHVASLDQRPAGLVSVCGPPPFRLDTNEGETGGVCRWSHRYMLLPQLGPFLGQEARIPYDINHLLACAAPRPVLVVSPQLDREAPLTLVTRAVDSARQAYALQGAEGRLTQVIPEDYNRLGPETQALIVSWLREKSRS